MTPCMRLYAWLGAELQPVTVANSPFREWVETYADPGFQRLAVTLEDLLNGSLVIPWSSPTTTARR